MTLFPKFSWRKNKNWQNCLNIQFLPFITQFDTTIKHRLHFSVIMKVYPSKSLFDDWYFHFQWCKSLKKNSFNYTSFGFFWYLFLSNLVIVLSNIKHHLLNFDKVTINIVLIFKYHIYAVNVLTKSIQNAAIIMEYILCGLLTTFGIPGTKMPITLLWDY